MNVAAVMEEMGASLDAVEGLRGFSYPANAVVPPAALVGWPYDIDPELTMVRGAWSAVFPVLVVVGKADVKAARDVMSAHLGDVGPASVMAALNSGLHVAYDAARMTSARVQPVSIAGIEYLGAIIDVAVTGQGGM